MLVDGYLFSLNLWYIIDIKPKSSIFSLLVLEKDLISLNNMNVEIISMIGNFLIINCTGKNDKIGLKVDNNFFIHSFKNSIVKNENLILSILDLVNKHKVKINENFTVLVNSGPGSFSSLRIALAVAKGIKISKNVKLYSYKDDNLTDFKLENIEVLINKNLLEKNLIKPLYLS